ncbi:putative 3-methyladenine DNA glycosylase [Bradyrhizobium sp. Ce-3]|nr:putative 3-methyladenine DNA glycosylase [Bradyrhizobium sp. Ce-3]
MRLATRPATLADQPRYWQSCGPFHADSYLKMAQKPRFTRATAPRLGKTLKRAFFDRSVHEVAPELIGATFLVGGVGGIITEVEAYHHTEPAAHSYNGPTPRNQVMFGPPGFSYVYRSYGIHWCVNFVCEEAGSASAVLIRAIEPTHGLAAMRRRRGLEDERALCSGPGKLCEAMGITIAHSELPLDRPPIALHARLEPPDIVTGVRIGITKAVELPWRYGLKGSKFLSKRF